MTEFKHTATFSQVENMSRHDLLDWVNATVQGRYHKVEELCSGVAYCQMIEMIFPRSVGIKKIKMDAKLEHECLHNLKLFQSAFTRLKIDKSVPIDRLIKGRFQDNFEFLQWFKKFYDTHATGKENPKLLSTNTPSAATLSKIKPLRGGKVPMVAQNTKPSSDSNSKQTQQQQSVAVSTAAGSQTPEELIAIKDELIEAMVTVQKDRDFYFLKLQHIEVSVKNALSKGINVDLCNTMLQIMYAVDGDENTPPGASGAV